MNYLAIYSISVSHEQTSDQTTTKGKGCKMIGTTDYSRVDAPKL